MGASANHISIALFVSLSIAFVSSQSAGSNSSADAFTTSTVDPNSKGSLSNNQGPLRRCYECSTFDPEENCDNPTNKSIKTCAPGENLCRKVEQHITIDGSDHIRTFRQCATTGDLGECSERTGTYGFKSWYCQCDKDLCNSATNSFVSISLLVSLLITLFCFKNRI